MTPNQRSILRILYIGRNEYFKNTQPRGHFSSEQLSKIFADHSFWKPTKHSLASTLTIMYQLGLVTRKKHYYSNKYFRRGRFKFRPWRYVWCISRYSQALMESN